MADLSPELALVDGHLAARARQALPEAPDCLCLPHHGDRQLTRSRPRRVEPRAAALAAALVVLSGLILAPQREMSADPTPSTLGEAGRELSGASSGSVRLRWRPVDDASGYNVILWRNGRRVLDLWPPRAAVSIPTRRLERGAYEWFVYPIIRRDRAQRYGQLAGHGTIAV